MRRLRLNRWVITALAMLLLLVFFGTGSVAGYMYARENGSLPGIGNHVATLPTDSGAQSSSDLWKPFWDTYKYINSEYYGRPVDQEKLVNAAAEGMVSSLGDPYTSYLPPQVNAEVQSSMKGEFDGIGVYVDPSKRQMTVVSAIEGSPAARAGIRAGDVIIAVNGTDITGMDQSRVIDMIRGPKGTSVTLTIKRGNQKPFDVKVMRAAIEVPQVTYKLVDGDIGYIQATIFGDKTTAELDDALQKAHSDHVKGIILDLRNNPGGYVNSALEMLGRFLPNGVGMYEDTSRGPGGETPLSVINGPVHEYDLPMVVLVNQGTASAAEIVSGGLQARGRAKLVGEKTFGKGSEQAVHDLPNGASAHITRAHWLTPDKQDIHHKGLQPDYVVKTGAQDYQTTGPQFQKAVQVLQQEMQK